jgi:hypothetical protein
MFFFSKIIFLPALYYRRAKRGTASGHLAKLEAEEEQMDGGNRQPGSFALGKSEQK